MKPGLVSSVSWLIYRTELPMFCQFAGFKETMSFVRLLGVKSLKLHIGTVLYFITFMTNCNVLKLRIIF